MNRIAAALCGLVLFFTAASGALAQVNAPPAPAASPGSPQVEIQTNMGTITAELYADKVPKTVANFLEYVKSSHYDGTIFHRVIDGFMIQGGGFNTKMQEKKTRNPVENEAGVGSRAGIGNRKYTLAMARTNAPHSATAQFFINTVENFGLDYRDSTPGGWGYAVFGRVIKGMDVVEKIVKVPTRTMGPFENVPAKPVIIESIKLVSAAPDKG